MFRLLRKLAHLPRMLWLSLVYSDAADDVAQGRILEAREKLLRVQAQSPRNIAPPAPASLLLSLVHFRLGDADAAAEMAEKAITQARSIVRFVSPAECAYMSYAGKLIYERATQASGRPKTIDVAVRLEDLRLEQVREEIRTLFPLAEFVPTEGTTQ